MKPTGANSRKTLADGRYDGCPIGKNSGRGKQRGFDAGKKEKGRKRHIAVDTMGNLLTVCVHSAGIQDRRGARLLMIRLYGMFATLSVIWAEAVIAAF